jgi:hypothetical protein
MTSLTLLKMRRGTDIATISYPGFPDLVISSPPLDTKTLNVNRPKPQPNTNIMKPYLTAVASAFIAICICYREPGQLRRSG